MPTTSNFGWTTPADTDLVKDGALAIRTLGNGIDTSLIDLKGGTTGQILSKASNTDLDYTWITNDVGDITNVAVTAPITGGGSSGSVTIGIDDGTTTQKGAVQLEDSTSSTSTTKAATPNSVKSAYDLANAAIPKSLVDAAGDLIYATADNTVARLALGTAGQVLKVNSGATAPEWGTATATTFPAFSATPNALLTPSQSTNTKVLFQTETFDSDGTFASSTFTPNKAGYYQINCNLLCNNNGRVIVYLYKNNDVYTRLVDHNSTVNIVAAGSCLVSMNGTTDYLELYIYMTGATRSVDSGATVTSFNGVGIRSN